MMLIMLIVLCYLSSSRRNASAKVERAMEQAALGDADTPHTLPPPPGTPLHPVAPLSRHYYLYPIEKLPIKRAINLNVPVNEFYDMAYMAEGTHYPPLIR